MEFLHSFLRCHFAGKSVHTYIFINPRIHMNIQDARTVSGEIEKEAKKN